MNEREELLQRKKQLETEISVLNVEQMALKILLNSFYGSMGSSYFRYFDIRLAEAVTCTGQVITRTIQEKINQYLQKLFPDYKQPFVIGGDTDSAFVSLTPVLSEEEHLDLKEKIELLDCFCQQRISPLIQKIIKRLTQQFNGIPGMINMGREYLGQSIIITKKKKYALLYSNKKGIYFDTPKQKITGIESVRSSTPPIIREMIKKTINHLFVENNDFILNYIEECKKKILLCSVDELAFPRSANNISKYSDTKGDYVKGTPIQTRAAIVFNGFIKKNKLESKYTPILEGEKIKFVYLKMPNPFHENVIGWNTNTVPPELCVEQFIDRNLMFETGFLSPIETLLESMGWEKEKKNAIEDWF